MPKFEITAPDGNTYEIEAPPGATEEEVLKFAIENYKQAPAEPPQPVDTSPIDYGMSDELINAATFGLADRVKAAGETAAQIPFDLYKGRDLNISDSYGKKLSGIHGERDRYRKEYPYRSIGAGVVGGFGNPLANVVSRYALGGKLAGSGLNAPTIGGKFLKTVPKRPSYGKVKQHLEQKNNQRLGQAMRRGALSGSGIAGYQAFNEADGNFLDRINSAQTAVALGGTTGAGIPAAVKGIATTGRVLADQLSRVSKHRQHSMALRKIAEALEQDGFTPDQAMRRIESLGPEAALMDVGENSRRLAYSVYARTGKGNKRIQSFLEKRQRGEFGQDEMLRGGQADRVRNWLTKKFPAKYEGKQNASDVAKLYDQAYKQNPSIQSDVIDKIARSHNGKIAFRKAVEMMDDSGEFVGKTDPELTALLREVEGYSTGVGVSSGLKLKTWDYFKKALQREQKQLVNKGDDEGVRIITRQIKAVTEELDRLDVSGGAYKQARRLSSDDFANADALKSGQKFLFKNMRSSDIAEMMETMSPAEQHHFRIGAIDTLEEKLLTTKSGSATPTDVLDNASLQRKISAIFGDDETYKGYIRLLKQEREMGEAYAIMGGSQTAKNRASTEASKIDPGKVAKGVQRVGKGEHVGGVLDVISGLKNKFVMPEPASDELGQVLTGKNLQGLAKKYTAQEMSRRIQNQLSNLGVRGVSPYIGRRERKKGILSN